MSWGFNMRTSGERSSIPSSGRHTRSVPSKAVSVAFWVTIIGGLGLAIGSVGQVPTALVIVALALFLGGTITVVVLSAADARRRDVGLGSAMWQGIRQGLRWIWAFMP